MKFFLKTFLVVLVVIGLASPAFAQTKRSKKHRTDTLSYKVPLRHISDPDIVPFDVTVTGTPNQLSDVKVTFRIVEDPPRDSKHVDEKYRSIGMFKDSATNAKELHDFVTRILDGKDKTTDRKLQKLIRSKVTTDLRDKGKVRILTIMVKPDPSDIKSAKATNKKQARVEIQNILIPFTTEDSEEIAPYHLGTGSVVIQHDRKREGYVKIDGYAGDKFDFELR